MFLGLPSCSYDFNKLDVDASTGSQTDVETELKTDTGSDSVEDTGSVSETDTGSDSVEDTGSGSETDTGSDTGTGTVGDTTSDTGFDTETDTETTDTGWDTSTDPQCSGKPDFMLCEVVTVPDRSYDICLSAICVSPGCGASSCNPPGPHFPLPDTGQRLCYSNTVAISCPSPGNVFYGQDAHYGWDKTHDAGERYTRTTPGDDQPIVQDNVTGLVWQGCPGGLSGAECDMGTGSIEIFWADALAHCDSMSWAGYSDWRLPDIFELASLVNNGRAAPAMDLTAFPGGAYDSFWTSTSFPYPDTVLRIDFNYGIEASALRTVHQYQVLCVRGGPFGGRRFETYAVNANMVVRDTLTGLEWQRCADGLGGDQCAEGSVNKRDWKTALSHCEGVSYASHTDWRLPSRAELVSIINLRRSAPCVDTAAFPETPPEFFWSSSSFVGNPSEAWFSEFSFGSSNSTSKLESYAVRCVRGGS